jgi:hypothetical protein
MMQFHNMSGAPRTVITQAASPRFATTTGVLVRLPEGIKGTPAEALLESLGITGSFTRRTARTRLCQLINERALALPLPPAALISDQATGKDRTEGDLLTICAVLSKSSNRIYMRDKEPNLSAILPSRRLILLIPNAWRPQ